MRIGIATRVRLFGEGVAASLAQCEPAFLCHVVSDFTELGVLARAQPPLDAAIIDVTQGIDLEEIRAFHLIHNALPLLALGLREREAEVVAHGQAGFMGYIRRDDGIAELCRKIRDAAAGRFACSPEIAAGIMRGLFSGRPALDLAPDLSALTAREEHIARLIARSLSNKEIAHYLKLSESTVKHHVHSVFAKLGMSRRVEVARSLREQAWDMRGRRRASG